MTMQPTNEEVAQMLERIAELLEAQEANPFRVQAYRRGAKELRDLEKPVAELEAKGGMDALKELSNIGPRLASLITEYLHTGASSLLLRLQGQVNPEELFAQVPGVGEELAERIVDRLNIHSLEELEQAAHDGRLEEVEGFGKKRLQSVRASLAGILSGYARRAVSQRSSGNGRQEEEPPVGLLLEIDQIYREKAEAGELKKIAPRRFNPDQEQWLPVYHTEKEGWDFTALFSNTKRAHDLGRNEDWVVIYYERAGREAQHTVVTETRGPLQGRRVVRGRERECKRFYFE